MMPSKTERRASPRVAVDLPVFYAYSLANRPKTNVLDLSVEGAGLEALEPLAIGSVTSFVFVTSAFQAIACQAKVMSLQPLPDAKYRVGVRFLNISEEGRQVVAQAVQSAVH